MAKRKRKDPRNKGISRIDSGSTHGWFVRGYKNGKTYSKLYSDRKCGGKRKAQKEARQYRDELHEKLAKIPTKPRGRRIVYRDSRNTTGVLGVCRLASRSPSGTINEYYTVTWRPSPGEQKATSFSIRKYGEKKPLNWLWRSVGKCFGKFMAPASFVKWQQDKKAPESSGLRVSRRLQLA